MWIYNWLFDVLASFGKLILFSHNYLYKKSSITNLNFIYLGLVNKVEFFDITILCEFILTRASIECQNSFPWSR